MLEARQEGEQCGRAVARRWVPTLKTKTTYFLDFCPFIPKPHILPCVEPIPLPSLFLFLRAPTLSLRLLRRSVEKGRRALEKEGVSADGTRREDGRMKTEREEERDEERGTKDDDDDTDRRHSRGLARRANIEQGRRVEALRKEGGRGGGVCLREETVAKIKRRQGKD